MKERWLGFKDNNKTLILFGSKNWVATPVIILCVNALEDLVTEI